MHPALDLPKTPRDLPKDSQWKPYKGPTHKADAPKPALKKKTSHFRGNKVSEPESLGEKETLRNLSNSNVHHLIADAKCRRPYKE